MATLFKIKTIAQYGLYEAWRSQIVIASTLVIVVSALLGEFCGQLVLTETWQTKLSIYCFVVRIGVVAVLALYVVNSLIRDRLDKQTECLLALDNPRYVYLYGRTVGFIIAGLMAAIVSGLYPFIYANTGDVILWTISLAAEIFIIILISVFLAISLSSSVIAFLVIGAFYILARNIAAILLIATSPILKDGSGISDISGGVIGIVHYLMPDLWKYADTAWIIYGDGNWKMLGYILAEAGIFSILLILAAAVDLYRKNI